MDKAVGIVRQSRGRDEALSPAEQRERIEDTCRRDGLELIACHEEIDVSGGASLEKRAGLSAAVEAIEAGEADVLMVAYFDRLVRSLIVQSEVVQRVEAAGGRVLTLDFGLLTAATAAQWLSGTMMGAVSEYYRRSVRERSRAGQEQAVARGVAPWPDVPPGYVRGEDGVLVPGPDAPVVREAFEMRAEGASLRACRDLMRERGVNVSYTVVQRMFARRAYLGEIRFGKLVNATAHEALVSADVWRAVQRVSAARGPQPRSDRLLARLGVLRCGGCGGAMGAGSGGDGRGGKVVTYRCPKASAGDCPRPAFINADIAENAVAGVVREALRDVEGSASAESGAREAAESAERAQADLDAAVRAFSGLADEPSARERLDELREARDVAVEEAHRLRGLHSALAVTGADWERLTLTERRALIRATVERAEVGPGRGASRVSVHLFSE